MRRWPIGALLLICMFVAREIRAQKVEEENSEAIQLDVPADIKIDLLQLEQATRQIIDQTNDFRHEQGLARVEVNQTLAATAQYFANYMARENKYGHTADGNRPSDRAKKHHYEYCIISENIAYVYSSLGYTAEEVATRFVTGWEKSPEHRKNILDADVAETGVAVAQSETSGYYFAVQMFGRPKSMRIEFTMSNRTRSMVRYVAGERNLVLPPGYRRIHYEVVTEKPICRNSPLIFAAFFALPSSS
jgi:uncharacterized protein YkwD